MQRASNAHLELWQHLNVIGAIFFLWLGVVLGLVAAAFPFNSFLGASGSLAQSIPLRPLVALCAVPGLLLGAYWVWNARKLQAGSFFETATDSDNALVTLFGRRARTCALYATVMGLIVLIFVVANYDTMKDLGALFHMSALASLLFASYGISYLYFHLSSR